MPKLKAEATTSSEEAATLIAAEYEQSLECIFGYFLDYFESKLKDILDSINP